MEYLTDSKSAEKRICVMGIGGAGCNMVGKIYRELPLDTIMVVAMNTDLASLRLADCHHRIPLGEEDKQGGGMRGDCDRASNYALQSREAIKTILSGMELVILVAGMGGGTGTGAAPIVAQIAKDLGLATLCIVAMPFRFEGARRWSRAEQGVAALHPLADGILFAPNFEGKHTLSRMSDLFHMVNAAVYKAVECFARMIHPSAKRRLDIADLTSVFSYSGYANLFLSTLDKCSTLNEAIMLALETQPLKTEMKRSNARLVFFSVSPMKTFAQVIFDTALLLGENEAAQDLAWGMCLTNELNEKMQIAVLIATNACERGTIEVRLIRSAMLMGR